MEKLSIKKLFSGYECVSIPDTVDENEPITPALTLSSNNEKSLLFITDKVKGDNPIPSFTYINSPPFAVVASQKRSLPRINAPIIRVENARDALSYALYNAYEIDRLEAKLIAVTGTNGKTTTSTLIYNILTESGYRVGFIGTGKIISNGIHISDESYSMTTPDPTLLYPSLCKMKKDKCEYIIMEVSSHSLALGKVSPLKFDYSIFTNLDSDHLDFHGTMDEYFTTKLSLFDKTTIGLFNLDDKYSKKALYTSKCEKRSFGVLSQGDAYATDICFDGLNGSSFFYREKDLIFKISTTLPGAFNIYNILAAIKCAIDLGIKPCIVKKAIESIVSPEGRMEVLRDDITVIFDYAHTPSAFENCLKTIKNGISSRQKLTVLFGCGGERDRNKRPAFGKHSEKYADNIIITEDNSRSEPFTQIASDIAHGIASAKYDVIPDRESAIKYAIENSASGDVIAIIGKGHEKYKITNGTYIPFDEKEIVRKLLKLRR